MGGQVLTYIVANIVLPLLKDLAFMLVNMFKVRQLRKEKEQQIQNAVKDYEKNPSPDSFNRLP
jgi:hypothetical protein